jgi:Tfp pilus assembly protein PilF
MTISRSLLPGYIPDGRFRQSRDLLTGRLQTDPDNIAAGSALAPLYLIAGRQDDAKKIYDAVLSRNRTTWLP